MGGRSITAAEVQIGLRIVEARKAAGVTRRALAAALGISDTQLLKIETGRNRVAAGRLQAIADHLGLPVTDLLGPAPDAPGPDADPHGALCDAFNAAHPVGSPVLIWAGPYRDGRPVSAIVAAPAAPVPGRAAAGPMVRVRGHGRIALTHVFSPGAGPARHELFLDGARIEAEVLPLRVERADAEALRAAARSRGLTAAELVLAVLRTVAADDLFDAVLDDRARPRARRAHAEAA